MGGKGADAQKAAVVGDTVGDPFKDTSSVAMKPVIKFKTLFGLRAVKLAVTLNRQNPMHAHTLEGGREDNVAHFDYAMRRLDAHVAGPAGCQSC